MSFPLPLPPDLCRAVPPGTRVLLGVSGGVDSSLALAILRHLECDVRCVTFRNIPAAGEGGRPCRLSDVVEDARRLAARFDVPHSVSDVEPRFRERVIDPFVEAYLSGRTPNPCVACNTEVRFPELVRLADASGLDRIATGHYARVERRDGEAALLRGLDGGKDQSYFLHGLERGWLERCLFPLGWLEKTRVREAAAALGLDAATRSDSQEICFVPDDDRSALFAGRGGETPGEIVDRSGRVLGEHRGLIHYTVGQRRGLGVAATEPLYVLDLDVPANRVVAGPREALAVRRVIGEDVRRLMSGLPDRGDGTLDGRALTAQIRYRQTPVPVAAWSIDGTRLEVELAEPAFGVAPGQSIVLYDRDRVLGGARIVSAA